MAGLLRWSAHVGCVYAHVVLTCLSNRSVYVVSSWEHRHNLFSFRVHGLSALPLFKALIQCTQAAFAVWQCSHSHATLPPFCCCLWQSEVEADQTAGPGHGLETHADHSTFADWRQLGTALLTDVYGCSGRTPCANGMHTLCFATVLGTWKFCAVLAHVACSSWHMQCRGRQRMPCPGCRRQSKSPPAVTCPRPGGKVWHRRS